MSADNGMEMVQVISDIYGSSLTDEVACILLHILCSGKIRYRNSEGDTWLLEHSQRHAATVLHRVDKLKNYTDWLGLYSDNFGGNFYEIPIEYQSLTEEVKEAISKHPSIVEINL
jgi:hypothetical protein